ncbi:pyridoxal phosphate-dependent decarboxylase family protein [Streptoalloteichus hindustanus]|uniref:Pyridoxal-dependent decarboxylase conserved domain-containing protein n=1 Tax=Streptoalloteichus hindustanus TaxID=2017 RepID=A0A1M5AC26_STRHI|nr:pyridoxal-dependent decarboxylase [Streptoalloteichus hindustanus]SHF27647.1 Pyridoxal-dependent decarboxylase conserved domain-containing protein [Streptoalloteichus hindustanus]
MSTQDYREVLEEIRPRLVDPAERVRDTLPDRVRAAFAALPRIGDPDDPWLGQPEPDRSWLREYERLPSGPTDADEVLRAATAGLAGQFRWFAPTAMFNIGPAPLVDSIAIRAVVDTYSPNALWDFCSSGVLAMERQLGRQLAALAGWATEEAAGVTTFGGKTGLTYAVRLGLNRCSPGVSSRGVVATTGGRTPVVIATDHVHDSLEQVCSLLGLGSRAVVRVPSAGPEVPVDPGELGRAVADLVGRGVPIACVVLSGGDIGQNAIDPVGAVVRELDRVRAEHDMAYRPFVHFDTAVSWVWLFFRDYDFAGNPLGVDATTLAQLRTATAAIAEVSTADSMTVDFHKTGCVSYAATVYVVRDAAELYSVNEDEPRPHEWRPEGQNLVHHTIEHSRSGAPVLASWLALQSLGVDGFRSYLANMLATNNRYRELLPQYGFELLNPATTGLCSIYWPVAPGGPTTFDELLASNSTTIDDANRYTYALYRILGGFEGNPYARVVLGYLPAQGRGRDGDPVAGLRLLPCSAFTDRDTAELHAQRMGEVKKGFDVAVRYREGRLGRVPLDHVPE